MNDNYLYPRFSTCAFLHLGWLCVLAVTLGCGGDDSVPPADPEVLGGSELAILTLGDSRVEGARPQFESYRYELWKNLTTAGYRFNFVGPFEDEATYPPVQDLTFDNDHGGIGGDTAPGVLDRLDAALQSANRPPDVVILGIGGNDILSGATVGATTATIAAIIDQIQGANAEVTIFLEQISGARSDAPDADRLNALIPAFSREIVAMAASQTTTTSTVIPVDMASGIPDAYFIDDVHFNETGAKAIADRYFQAIEAVFP